MEMMILVRLCINKKGRPLSDGHTPPFALETDEIAYGVPFVRHDDNDDKRYASPKSDSDYPILCRGLSIFTRRLMVHGPVPSTAVYARYNNEHHTTEIMTAARRIATV